LLTADQETVEVAHEALIREWPRLRAWLDEDRAALRIHRYLTQAATAWDEAGREPSELFAGARLATAIDWQRAAQPELNEVELQFLASSKRRERSRAKRRHGLIAGMAILTVGAVLAAVLAVTQQRRASRNAREAVTQQQRAEDTARETALRALVARSAALRDSERDTGALLAVAAYKIEPRLDTLGALVTTFAAASGVEGTIPLAKPSNTGVPLPDGHTYAVLEEDSAVHLIDLDARREVGRLPPGPDFPWFLGVTHDGRTLVEMAGGVDDVPNLLVQWDLTTKARRIPDVAVDFNVGSAAISPDGRLVALGGDTPARVEVRSLDDGSLIQTIPGLPQPEDFQYHTSTAAVTFLPDGTLVVGSQQGALRIIDPISGTELRRLDGPLETSEGQLIAAPDGRSVYGGGARGTMAWDLVSGQVMWKEPTSTCEMNALVAKLGALLCALRDGQMRTYGLADGLLLSTKFDYQQGDVRAADTTPDGTRLIVAGGSSLGVWRLDGGGPVSHTLPNSTGFGSLEFDGLGHLLANRTRASMNQGAAVLDPTTGAVVDPLAGVVEAFTTPRVGRLFAWFEDGTGGFYDLAERRRIPGFSVPLPFHYRWGYRSGNLLIVGSGVDGLVQGVDLTTGQLTPPKIDSDFGVGGAIASPDGRRLFTADDVGVRRLDGTATGESLPAGTRHLAFGRDLMVADSIEGNLRVLDSRTLQPIGAELPVIRGEAHDLVLSSDASRLMVVGSDRTIRLADMAKRSFLGDPIDMGASVPARDDSAGLTAPALSADGQIMAYSNKFGVIVWDLDPDHLVAGACQVASRNLTRAEWEENIGSLAPYTELCPGQPSG
jgi:WD40 repeat protein